MSCDCFDDVHFFQRTTGFLGLHGQSAGDHSLFCQPAVPGADGFMNPSERESLLSGRLNAMYRAPSSESGERRALQGPHGHVIE